MVKLQNDGLNSCLSTVKSTSHQATPDAVHILLRLVTPPGNRDRTYLGAGKGVLVGALLVQGEEGMMALHGNRVQHGPDVC